jgi:hypothetical protein
MIRPFDNFKTAIGEPYYFFGRSDLLAVMKRSPLQVRILLGGRRSGKTTALNAVKWSLLDSCNGEPYRAFPVLIDLQEVQPKSLDNFRYLLIARLAEAIIQKKKGIELGIQKNNLFGKLSEIEIGIEEINFFGLLKLKVGSKFNVENRKQEYGLSHDEFRKGLLELIRKIQTLNFEGVCFLLDSSEFIVSQDWANDTWSYLRGLKDTDTALKPFLGFLLSGYRDLKDYQQRVGSPLLNIAEVEWLRSLTETETRSLIIRRCECEDEPVQLTEQEVNAVIEWAGCHPYLTQQMLNAIFDNRRRDTSLSFERLIRDLIRQRHDKDFSVWWNGTKSYSLGENERAVYLAMVQQRQGTAETLAQQVQLSEGQQLSEGAVEDALEVLAGTGVIRQLDEEQYAVGAKLFEQWVAKERC